MRIIARDWSSTVVGLTADELTQNAVTAARKFFVVEFQPEHVCVWDVHASDLLDTGRAGSGSMMISRYMGTVRLSKTGERFVYGRDEEPS